MDSDHCNSGVRIRHRRNNKRTSSGQPGLTYVSRVQYFFSRLPREQLVFEGQYAPHLYLYQGLIEKGAMLYRKPVWAWSVAFMPMLRLRMLSTASSPVVPPSCMPRPFLDWQIFRASVDMNKEPNFTAGPIRLWGLTFSPRSHHSNGKDVRR